VIFQVINREKNNCDISRLHRGIDEFLAPLDC